MVWFPQRRYRLYIVALAHGQKFIFPEFPKLKPMLRNVLDEKISMLENMNESMAGIKQNTVDMKVILERIERKL